MKIKINDTFYRYIDMVGMFSYIVKGIRNYEGESLYELECQSCTHGYKCLLLCSINDYDKLIYVRMLNNHDDNDQKHFHVDSGQFFSTKREALIDKGEKVKIDIDNRIAKQEQYLKTLQDEKATHVKYVADLIDNLKENN